MMWNVPRNNALIQTILITLLFRLAPAMSSEEKRIETRKEIMENESIFSPSKLCSNTASESLYKSSKAQKIESFKKVPHQH